MRGSTSRLALGGAAVVLGLGGGAGLAPLPAWIDTGGDDGLVRSEVAFSFTDERIDESSGLVARGRTFWTVNDSGDEAVVYAVDGRTGATTGTTSYAGAEPDDVEALAPGPGATLWVGDIGDNNRDRSTVAVHRVGADGSTARFELAYPDGPHDAEALLVHPRTGRVLVVSKVPLLGGTVYAAPRRLEEGSVHRMAAVSRVRGTVTDGAFLPDGRHVVLRTYGSAGVYTYPGFEQVADLELPDQDQGEAVAVSRGGEVFLSSEGALSEVLRVTLPASVRSAVAGTPSGAPASASPSPAVSAAPAPEASDPASDDRGTGAGDGVGLGRPRGYAVAAVLGALVVGALVRAARRRGRRRR